MEIDKRSSYVWIIVLIANIGTALGIILSISSEAIRYSYVNPFQYIFSSIISLTVLYVIGISLFLSIVPVLISKAKNKWVRALGYGIPILLLLPISYFIYDFYTCTGKFCGMQPLLLGWACVISAVIISIFYTVGSKVNTWSKKTFLWIIWIEIILIISALIFGYISIQ
jgi:hypothetical protein